jgi:hypothetical protein
MCDRSREQLDAYHKAQKAARYKEASERDLILAETIEDIIAGEQQTWRSLPEKSKAQQL